MMKFPVYSVRLINFSLNWFFRVLREGFDLSANPISSFPWVSNRMLEWRFLCFVLLAVGYTMRDIRYKWNAGLGSVGISNEVELPQFRVLGHRQRQTTIHLSTGIYHRWSSKGVPVLVVSISYDNYIHHTTPTNNTPRTLFIQIPYLPLFCIIIPTYQPIITRSPMHHKWETVIRKKKKE